MTSDGYTSYPRKFTPRDWSTNTRLEMTLSHEDSDRFSNLPHRSRRWIEVNDSATGKRYKARRASCGLGCFCDAVVRPLENEEV